MHLPLLLLLSSLPPAALAGAPANPDTAYERILDQALARAQTRLVNGIDLWVDHSSWENAWEVTSKHYMVRTTDGRHLAASIGQGLDTMLGHFQRVLGTEFTPDQPFQVLIFPTLAEYNAFGDSVGAEHSSSYGSFYADQDPRLPVATYRTQRWDRLSMWITHSASHQFVNRAFQSNLPIPIAEGLAAYFELYWASPYEAHNKLKDSDDYVPLGDLLQESFGGLMRDADTRLTELGLFFSYLLDCREDTRLVDNGEEQPENSFAEYLRMVVRGQDPSNTGFARLMRNNFEGLEEDFRAFTFPR